MLMVVLFFIISALISYLLGSINFAVIMSNLFEKKDVREMGSGNAGMTNVLRNFGPIPGILTFLGDALKAISGVFIGMYIFAPLINDIYVTQLDKAYIGYVCALFAMLGHIFPVFFQFRGGKGIVVAISSIFMLDWRVGLVLLSIFLIVVLISGIVSISSIIGALAFPITAFIFNLLDTRSFTYIVICLIFGVLMATLTIFMHRENIKRLIKGEEKKLRIKKTEKR